MSATTSPVRPGLVDSILHPTDLSEDGLAAFAHALAIALVGRTKLTLLNVSDEGDRSGLEWSRFPAVRPTLERWGLLEADSPRGAVERRLGVRIAKVSRKGDEPVKAIVRHLDERPADLLVLATAGRRGLPKWIERSVAERVARRARLPTLFVPTGARGFVDPDHGHLSLRHILLPVDESPRPDLALAFAVRAAERLGDGEVAIHLLHVGEASELPTLVLPRSPCVHWKQLQRAGSVVDGIVAEAGAVSADLVVMPTAGREGLLDVLRGSHTEQVLRRIRCPLLAVPAVL